MRTRPKYRQFTAFKSTPSRRLSVSRAKRGQPPPLELRPRQTVNKLIRFFNIISGLPIVFTARQVKGQVNTTL